VSTEHREVLLGRCELVHGNRHQIVGELQTGILIEVVADP
jgi:hypothetical protein